MIAPVDFSTLALQCAPQVAPATLSAIVRTESGFNPYAIGVAGGRLVRQPASVAEAVATVHALERGGWNYSVGLGQINRTNFSRYGLTSEAAFDPCRNVATAAAILARCYAKARTDSPDRQQALRRSFSCYSAGDFVTGYRTGYVQRVVDNAAIHTIPAVPAIDSAMTPIRIVPLDATGQGVKGQLPSGAQGTQLDDRAAGGGAGPPGGGPWARPGGGEPDSVDGSAVVF